MPQFELLIIFTLTFSMCISFLVSYKLVLSNSLFNLFNLIKLKNKRLNFFKNFNCLKKIKGTSLFSAIDFFNWLKGFKIMDIFYWANIMYIIAVIILLVGLVYSMVQTAKLESPKFFWVIFLLLYSLDIFLFSEAKLIIFKRYNFFSPNFIEVYLSILKLLLFCIHLGYFSSLTTTLNYKNFKDNEYTIILMTVLLIYIFFFKTSNFVHIILWTELVSILLALIGYLLEPKSEETHIIYLCAMLCLLKIALKLLTAFIS